MKKALIVAKLVTVEMLREDRTLRTEITGELHADLSGDVSGLRGCVSGLRGDVYGLRGDVDGLRGNVDACDLTTPERDAGVSVSELIA